MIRRTVPLDGYEDTVRAVVIVRPVAVTPQRIADAVEGGAGSRAGRRALSRPFQFTLALFRSAICWAR
ncbi:hypothetical protein ABZ864_34705 [Streptomyces sp. NPDC047082]|uniref:hypothetical protein n=1 Tax=Streptomyces sp. NPDC047082 TaxID=3155259 RepID=UPI0033EF99B6